MLERTPNLTEINELSQRLSVSNGTLYNWVYLHRTPFIKAARFLRFGAEDVIRSLSHCSLQDGHSRMQE
jgi:hypothetical protein